MRRLLPGIALLFVTGRQTASIIRRPDVDDARNQQHARDPQYAARRIALLSSIDSGVVVVWSEASPRPDYLPFVQNANFYYLTGVEDADCVLILVRVGVAITEQLFVPGDDAIRQAFAGDRLAPETARARVGVDGHPSSQFIATLDSLVARFSVVFSVGDTSMSEKSVVRTSAALPRDRAALEAMMKSPR